MDFDRELAEVVDLANTEIREVKKLVREELYMDSQTRIEAAQAMASLLDVKLQAIEIQMQSEFPMDLAGDEDDDA